MGCGECAGLDLAEQDDFCVFCDGLNDGEEG